MGSQVGREGARSRLPRQLPGLLVSARCASGCPRERLLFEEGQ